MRNLYRPRKGRFLPDGHLSTPQIEQSFGVVILEADLWYWPFAKASRRLDGINLAKHIASQLNTKSPNLMLGDIIKKALLHFRRGPALFSMPAQTNTLKLHYA
ncbi:MAG: hypothetical protein AAB756_00080 [Patescibacteria group bacterium]